MISFTHFPLVYSSYKQFSQNYLYINQKCNNWKNTQITIIIFDIGFINIIILDILLPTLN